MKESDLSNLNMKAATRHSTVRARKKPARAPRPDRASAVEQQRLNETLAALFQFAPDAMLLVDAGGGIARLNERAEAMFGYTLDELAGKRIEVLVPARFRKQHAKHRAHYAEEPHRREMGAGRELAARRKDGTEFPVDIMLSPLETPEGPCVIATVRDITVRKRSEQELTKAHRELEAHVRGRAAELAQVNALLREDAERLSSVLALKRQMGGKANDSIAAMGMIARRAQEIFHADGAAIDLLEQDELVVRTPAGIATRHVSVWLGIAAGLARECFRTGESFCCADTETDPRVDREACRKVGLRAMLVVPFEHAGAAAGVLKVLSGRPRVFDDRDVRLAAIMADLVSSALSQSELQESRKLASLAVVAAGVAHEIRNPLTAIKARLYTHQKRFAAGSSEAEDIVFISEEIGRLERIVREFLQFARPGDPLLAPVSPAEMLGEVRELLAPELAKSSIHLTVADVVATPIHADRQQIKQVLINLVHNAAESIGHDGRITLRARQRRVGLGGRARDVVTLEVRDTGPGIPPDVQARLFDPFFTTKPSGTGLGLSIAARIVEKHGGALRFSTSAKGAAFRLLLPIATTA